MISICALRCACSACALRELLQVRLGELDLQRRRLNLAVHDALLNLELLFGLDQGELRLLHVDLLQVDRVLRRGRIQLDQQVALLHVAAFGHDVDDARRAFHFAANDDLIDRLQVPPSTTETRKSPRLTS